jgi:hypothetical protein
VCLNLRIELVALMKKIDSRPEQSLISRYDGRQLELSVNDKQNSRRNDN